MRNGETRMFEKKDFQSYIFQMNEEEIEKFEVWKAYRLSGKFLAPVANTYK